MFRTALSMFFSNDTPTTEIYTLSLHDALPIFAALAQRLRHAADRCQRRAQLVAADREELGLGLVGDRKSTRLNSSHANISYAVFCLKKKISIERARRPRRSEEHTSELQSRQKI